MYPVVCQIGPFTVYSYGLSLVIAFLLCSRLAVLLAKKNNLNPEVIFNAAFFSLLSGILGARIFYVLENLSYYRQYPREVFMLQQGGLSWFGGLLAGALCAYLYIRRKGLGVLKVLDLLSPFLALAQAIGRIGCFLNGCCFGRVFWVPVQLVSALWLVAIFIILRLLQERPHKNGQIFFSYLLLYSLKRFFIEFWRQDSDIIFLRFSLFQVISIVVFFLALIGYARIYFKRPS